MFNENANSYCVLTFCRIYVSFFFVAWWSARYLWISQMAFGYGSHFFLSFWWHFIFWCVWRNKYMVYASQKSLLPKAVNFSWGIVLNSSALEWHFDKHGKFLFIPQYSWSDCELLDKMRNGEKVDIVSWEKYEIEYGKVVVEIFLDFVNPFIYFLLRTNWIS